MESNGGWSFLHGYPMSVVAGAELLEGPEELWQQTQRHYHWPDERKQKRNDQVSPTGPLGSPNLSYSTVMVSPVVGEVLQTALDEAHADLTVSEPADQRTQQLLGLIDQAFG